MRSPKAFHDFSQEFQCRFAIATFRDIRFQHLAFVIDGTPKVVHLTVDFHENLIQMPLPIGVSAQLLDAFPADLGRKYWAKPVPPESNRLVADTDAALVEKILHIPERKREPDIQHHRKADDLRAGLEITKWTAFGHGRTVGKRPAGFKPDLSDTARSIFPFVVGAYCFSMARL